VCWQALLPLAKGGAHKYQAFCIHELPDDISSGGMRGGAINELQCPHPFPQNIHVTGQDGGVKKTAFYSNYAGYNKGAGNTCGATLVGWPTGDYGRLRQGPFCAELSCLRDIGVDLDQLQEVIDKQFNLHSASFPDLLRGGRLRPFVERCFASLLMYYPERCVKNSVGQVSMIEMREVSIKLVSSLREKYSFSAGGMANGGDPDLTLRRWAAHIKVQFDLANLSITSRQETGVDANIIVSSVQGLGGTLLSDERLALTLSLPPSLLPPSLHRSLSLSLCRVRASALSCVCVRTLSLSLSLLIECSPSLLIHKVIHDTSPQLQSATSHKE
jgi:hypothetical protein